MGCFNPAVAIGIDVASVTKVGGFGVFYSLVYTAFELVGAALAAGAFMVCRAKQESQETPEEARDPDVQEGTAAKLLSEFLGTYMLVLTVGLNVLSGSAAGAFSIAASLMSMIFALGTVSGAHFNPAVTTAIMCSGRDKCSTQDGLMYMSVQIVGGICAALTYSALNNGETFALKPPASTWGQVAIAEFVFTFVLAFVVLSVATVKNPLSEYFGFAIGMCVTVGGCAIGKVSGGSLNPAVSIGITTSHSMKEDGGKAIYPCLIYALVEVAAGVAASGVFRLTQESEYSKDEQSKV
jgi:aquaporin Z